MSDSVSADTQYEPTRIRICAKNKTEASQDRNKGGCTSSPHKHFNIHDKYGDGHGRNLHTGLHPVFSVVDAILNY